jgi:hypothetical protein
MTSGAQTQDSQFIEVSWRFPRCSHQFQSLLLASRVFSWLTGILGDEVDDGRDDERLHCDVFTWRLSIPMWAVEVDGLA